LRDIEDSDAIAERLGRGGKVVVVGSGWIGSEVAASARQKGLEVTVLMQEEVPLARRLGSEVGMEYRGDTMGADQLVFRGDRDARNFDAYWLDREDRVVASANVHTHEHAHGHGEHHDHHGHDHGDHGHAAEGHAAEGDGVGSIEALIRSRARVDVRKLTDPDEDFEGLTHTTSQAS
jgi:hypothetical protein